MSGPGPAKTGFGFIHDGSVATLTDFVNLPVFSVWPNDTENDIVAFLRSFDTGTAPAVGYQITVDAGKAQSSTLSLRSLALRSGLMSRARWREPGTLRGGGDVRHAPRGERCDPVPGRLLRR